MSYEKQLRKSEKLFTNAPEWSCPLGDYELCRIWTVQEAERAE